MSDKAHKMIIVLLGEDSPSLGHLDLDGISGKPYKFIYDKTRLSYVYIPKDQEEVNDIFQAGAVPRFPWKFVPEMAEMAVQKYYIPPFVSREKYARLDLEGLTMLATDCGIPILRPEPDLILAQLDAYMLGRGLVEKKKDTPKTAPVVPPPEEPQERHVLKPKLDVELEQEKARTEKPQAVVVAAPEPSLAPE